MSTSEFLNIVERSAAAWNQRLSGTGAPRLRVELGSDTSPSAIQDGVNRIFLRSGRWCPPGARDEEEGCYAPERQAITHLYRHTNPGQLAEADIEINGVTPRFTTAGGGVDPQRLEALLVHEWGHVLGLDHSCGLLMTRAEHAGDSVRPCDDAAAKASVMYPDPLEANRALLLQPSEDALTLLAARYEPATGVAAVAVWLTLAAVVIAAGVTWRVRRARIAERA